MLQEKQEANQNRSSRRKTLCTKFSHHCSFVLVHESDVTRRKKRKKRRRQKRMRKGFCLAGLIV
jgi:hypothetical protein